MRCIIYIFIFFGWEVNTIFLSCVQDLGVSEEEVYISKDIADITEELREHGIDGKDLEDLVELAGMMAKFVSIILSDLDVYFGTILLTSPPQLLQSGPHLPDLGVARAQELQHEAQLYLLGLPNKLGPLGFLALHGVVEG